MPDDKNTPTLVKCLVWDLDNTLWRGVLLENDEVVVPEAIRDVIVELDARGVLHAVSSKNDHDLAWERLRELGLADYFVAARIGWGRKSDAVREIVGLLEFTESTVAFIDDQATERAEVEFHLPEIRCYPAERATELPGLPEFTPASRTADSGRRRTMYQANLRRNAERAEYQGPDAEFLRSLDLRLTVARAGEEDIARAEELTVRTSQMNATGVHYSDADLRALLTDAHHEVLVASLSDRFGSHGVIGIVLVAKHASSWHLKLLATSCRVMSFGIGAVLLGWIADQASRAEVHVIADFRRTDRNRIMEVAYRFAGYEQQDCGCAQELAPDGNNIERLHLKPVRQEPPVTLTLAAPDLTG